MRKCPVICTLFLLLSSCYPEEQRTATPTQSLYFSLDTLHLDTLLSDTKSPSYSIRLYNSNPGRVHIQSILLGRRDLSPFSFSISGRSTKSLEDQWILGKDSLLILVNIEPISKQQLQPYEEVDQLRIESSAGLTAVTLSAFVQDITRHTELIISEDTEWKNISAQFIGKSLVVEENVTLTLGAGMRLLFEQDAFMLVKGHLQAIGTSALPIIFTSARRYRGFTHAPGQWQGLRVAHGETTQQLSLKYVEVSNAVIGLRLGNSENIGAFTLELGHSVLKNMSVGALIAFGGTTHIYNSLMYNCGNYIVTHYAGGTHSYQHCTLSNYPSMFFRFEPSFYFTHSLPGLGSAQFAMRLSIENSILWGELSEELLLASSAESELSATHNILRTLRSDIFDNSNYIHHTSLNFPGFLAPEQHTYSFTETSFGKDKGKTSSLSTDIRNQPRDDQPDIGAYEYVLPKSL